MAHAPPYRYDAMHIACMPATFLRHLAAKRRNSRRIVACRSQAEPCFSHGGIAVMPMARRGGDSSNCANSAVSTGPKISVGSVSIPPPWETDISDERCA
ncbi:hypothetical protein CIB48_g8613 [Xylaria polymorpha]|nr:hypothetical protein CIB48_g8613 [Xylaria polymorpha]